MNQKNSHKKLCITLTLIAIFALAILPQTITATTSDNWSMFHHDLNHTGTSTSNPTATAQSLLWNYTTNSVVWASAAVVMVEYT